MTITLPAKIFRTLAPTIKGNVGEAREVEFAAFIKVFTSYFGCTLNLRKGNRVKVSPPRLEHGLWHWPRVPFFVYKPAHGTLGREEIYRLRKTFNELYKWDKKTFTRGGGRA